MEAHKDVRDNAPEGIGVSQKCRRRFPNSANLSLAGKASMTEKMKKLLSLLDRAECEMRYAGWDKPYGPTFDTDNMQRNKLYKEIKELFE